MATNIKFGRKYLLQLQLQDGSYLEIKPPITIEFEIHRQILGSLNYSQIRIFNLNSTNRELLRYDVSFTGDLNVRYVYLYAGYGTNLPLIFHGNMTEAFSVREGVNFITTIKCFDGENANTNGVVQEGLTFPAGTTTKSFYEKLMGKGLDATLNTMLPGVLFGAIGPSFVGNEQGPYIKTRSDSLTGNTIANLLDRTSNCFFIDNGKSFILKNTECRQGQIATINAAAGLLATPLREASIITFDMVFEPAVVIGQLVNLESTSNPAVNSSANGPYKITSFSHKGMISEAVCGDVITTMEFIFGAGALKVVTDQ